MTDQTLLIDDPRDGAEVHLDLGAAVRIGLPAPGATGYVWELARAPRHVTVAEPSTAAAEPDAPAAAGMATRTTFAVSATDAGTDTLTFALRRPWEDEPVDEVHVRVVVG